ncbi:hypothetical protein [Acinetobacter baylyi]|nr:hypothetical protein [Acinetobacter baylyi]MDR6187634.1 hypothetical protein [Acinetobacter baylyi]
MTYDEARLAIILRAQTFTHTDFSQSRIKYPNAPQFQVPATGLWSDINILWGQSFIAGLADTPCTRRTGVVSINCFARPDTHEVKITQLADAWLSHFEYFSIGQLEILQGQIQNLGNNSDFIQYNVSISYRVN